MRLAAIAAFVVLAACSTHPALPNFGFVPDFVLTDQTGAAFSSKEKLDGKVWIANFIFTTCQGPCPRMSSQMSQARQRIMLPDVRFVSFTIDPDRDTPEVLAAYGRRFQADSRNWHFLTGSKSDLNKLSYDAFHLGNVGGPLEHSTRFVLVDRKSRIRGYYDTSEPEVIEKLIVDTKRLAEERF
jgi:protein SCO1